MAYSIAVAGKGGTGKTTLSALIIATLLKSDRRPVLAVDADPNSNLNETLGVKIDRTVVSIVDGIMDKKEDIPAGMTKERLLEYHLQDALIESNGFDLLVMGHTEGPGCYCSANNLLRDFMERLKKNYNYLVMDNEAGMEHLSRRTTRDIDALLITANPAPVSLRTAQRIYEMASKLKLKIKKTYLVINEIQPPSKLEGEVEDTGISLLGNIPYDEEIKKCSINETSLLNLSEKLPSTRVVREMVRKLIG